MTQPFDLAGLRQHLSDLVDLGRDRGTLQSAGGNLLFLFPGAASFTIITSGPHAGLHDHADLDEPVHFMMVCDPELVDLAFGGGGADLSPFIAAERIILEGDAEIFKRFLRLAKSHNVIGMFAARSR